MSGGGARADGYHAAVQQRRSQLVTAPDAAKEQWLGELTNAITSVTRLAHSNKLYDAMGARAGLDLRPYLFGVLSRIRDMQPVRMSDVADEMDYDRSTVSRHVAELVTLGCVRRLADPGDGRVVILELTPAGEAALEKVFRAWNTTLDEITSDWKPADQKRFLQMLQRFGAAFTEHVAQL
jgi:DNA-binding MarR family transcriptional regulator